MRVNLHARAFPLTLATLLLATAGARAETYWLDGYEVEVTLEPQRESFLLREPVGVGLEFENHTETFLELMLSRAGGEAWPDDFEVTVTGPDGETLPRPDGERPETLYQNIQLYGTKNGFSTRHKAGVYVSLNDWAKIEKPGRRGASSGR